METPTLVRHAAVVGHLGHGKTLLMDVLVGQSRWEALIVLVRAGGECLFLSEQVGSVAYFLSNQVECACFVLFFLPR